MMKGICNKCNSLINVDEKTSTFECPNCHEQIFTETALKNYSRAIITYKRKGEIAMLGSTNYADAYKYYSLLLNLRENDLETLMLTVIAKLYISNMHLITIKEATDILLKGSDNVEIGKYNVALLSDFLIKIREDSKKIVDAFSKVKEQSMYSYNLYKKSLEEYKYFLDAYLSIYNALKDLAMLFKDSKDLLNDEIKNIKTLLKEKVVIKNKSTNKHIFTDLKGNEYINIFPDKHKLYKIRMGLYITMGIGVILSIVGLILLAVNVSPAVKFSILGVGLVLFIGGYFVNHKLKSINYNLNY